MWNEVFSPLRRKVREGLESKKGITDYMENNTCFFIRKPLSLTKSRKLMTNFDTVLFCKDAEAFLNTLEEKTRAKVLYNIRKAQFIKDQNLFKRLNEEI